MLFDHGGRLLKAGDLDYYYDESGVTGVRQGENYYHFRKDILGNILQILDSNGNIVVEYEYDAWGNHKVLNADGAEITDGAHIGNMNVLRYRGYIYDTVSGLYYLNARFYDPETGRFISMDDISYADVSTYNGLNLYAYCRNNPIMYFDPTGHIAWLLIAKAVAAVVAVVAVGVILVNHIINGIECAVAETKVKDRYTEEEAKKAIEEILGDKDKTVTLDKNNLHINNSYEGTSRYDRILISKIYQNTFDENGNRLTGRTVYGLSAEWALHNAAYGVSFAKKQAKDVDLDTSFKTNRWYTEVGTVALAIFGCL